MDDLHAGIRTSKTVNGVVYHYYYDGSQLARMTYGDNVLDFSYDINGVPVAMRHGYASHNNYVVYYYITNLQGDVVRLVDIYGNTAAYYEYDAFGNVLEASGSHANVNPLRYRGYVYDHDTGLYYLQSRYYDPRLGRYLNHDVLFDYNVGIRGYNLFAYCGNSPVFRLDPNGRASIGAEKDGDPTNDTVSEKEGGGTGVNSGMPSAGTWNAFRRTLQSAADGLGMATGTHKGFQKHHMLSNKNKTYSPQYKEVTDKYNPELDQDWNTVYLNNHRGRHTNAYHQFMLEAVHYVDDIAQGDPYVFIKGFGVVSDFLTENTWVPYGR